MREEENVVRGWSLDGMQPEEIAKGLGISVRTLKRKYGAALQSAFVARGMMLDALYKLACGYEAEEQQVVKLKREGGEEGRVETIKKHVPPAPTILKFLAEARLGLGDNSGAPPARPLQVFFGEDEDG